MACLPPDGKYWKDSYDWLFVLRTFFWDKVDCKYRLLSSMTDQEYSLYYSDPNYAALFADGGGSAGKGFDIDITPVQQKKDPAASDVSASIFDGIEKYLVPVAPERNTAIRIVLLIIIAAVAGYFIYKNFIQK